MAVTTIKPKPGLLPDGTDVGLYLRRAVDVERQKSAAPLAAPVAKGEMAAGAFTTEAALTANTDYVLIGHVDEIQTVTVKAKKGKFKLVFQGQTTAGIKFDATAAEVKEALEALSNIAAGDVAVTGGPGDEGGTKPYVVIFRQTWGGTNVTAMTADVTELEETPKTVTIATTTQGSKGGAEGIQRYVMHRTPPA